MIALDFLSFTPRLQPGGKLTLKSFEGKGGPLIIGLKPGVNENLLFPSVALAKRTTER